MLYSWRRGEHQAALAVVTKALQFPNSKGAQASTRPASSPASGPPGPVDLLLLRIKAAVVAAGGDHNAALQALLSCRKGLTAGSAKEAAVGGFCTLPCCACKAALPAFGGTAQAKSATRPASLLLAVKPARPWHHPGPEPHAPTPCPLC